MNIGTHFNLFNGCIFVTSNGNKILNIAYKPFCQKCLPEIYYELETKGKEKKDMRM